jgi:hypothetical protein
VQAAPPERETRSAALVGENFRLPVRMGVIAMEWTALYYGASLMLTVAGLAATYIRALQYRAGGFFLVLWRTAPHGRARPTAALALLLRPVAARAFCRHGGTTASGKSRRRRGHRVAAVYDPSRKPIVHRSRPTISAGAFLGAAMSDRPHAAPSPWQGTWGMASSAARSSR